MNLSGSSNKHPLDPKSLQNNSHSRRLEEIKTYSYKGDTVTAVDICVKNRGTFSNLQILHPTAFCFKEERVLAAHPPSCHP